MTVGTTPPHYIPRGANPKTIKPGEGYFLIQVHSAQVAFFGPPWHRAKGLVVTSNVNLNHPSLGGSVRAIQRSREVKENDVTQLGLNQNLVDLVPATMPNVSIGIDFILDRANELVALSGLINSDSFWAVVSLGSGAALVARTISGLAQKVIETFIPAQERIPTLQFNGDFNLATDGLQEGYYAILGSSDTSRPLPTAYQTLSVRNRRLLSQDLEVMDLSYVILEVRCTEARTRDLHGGAPWDAKLREAEDEAQNLLNNPMASKAEYEQGWKTCQALLREARALIRNDANYLKREADTIIQASYKRCEELVTQKGTDTRGGGFIQASPGWTIDTSADREILGVPQNDDELNAALDQYADQVIATRRTLREAGLR